MWVRLEWLMLSLLNISFARFLNSYQITFTFLPFLLEKLGEVITQVISVKTKRIEIDVAISDPIQLLLFCLFKSPCSLQIEPS